VTECKECGKNHNNKTYCSNKCKMIGIHKQFNIGSLDNSGKNNGMFNATPWNKGRYSVKPEYEKKCKLCKNKFYQNKNESMSHYVDRKFCGNTCMLKSLHIGNVGNKYNLGRVNTKQYNKNMSKIMKEKYKNGEIKPSFRMKYYKYKGIKFRSSWEVKFAKKCDMEGKPWEYEKHRFHIKSINTTYIPDFYLPEEDKFVEIKGYWYPQSKRKFKAFVREYSSINIEIIQPKK